MPPHLDVGDDQGPQEAAMTDERDQPAERQQLGLGVAKSCQPVVEDDRLAGQQDAILDIEPDMLPAIREDDMLDARFRSEENTSELQYLMRSSYAVFCSKQKTQLHTTTITRQNPLLTPPRVYLTT